MQNLPKVLGRCLSTRPPALLQASYFEAKWKMHPVFFLFLCFLLCPDQQSQKLTVLCTTIPIPQPASLGTNHTDKQLPANDFQVSAISLLTLISYYIIFFQQIFTLISSPRTTLRHRLKELFLAAPTAFLWILSAAGICLTPKQLLLLTVSRGNWDGHELPHLPSSPWRQNKQLTVFFIFSMKLLSLTGATLKDRRNLFSDEHVHF